MANLTNEEVEAINSAECLLDFQLTWLFKKFVSLPNRIIGLFTGNQAFKTSAVAYSYVWRIYGVHPIPKRNLLYFECSKRAKLKDYAHDVGLYNEKLAEYLEKHASKDSATFITPSANTNKKKCLPKDTKCPECGENIIIHRRKSRVFRFASEKLPTEKETVGGDSDQSVEIHNAQYPEFKKWLPSYLIKKDITHRYSAMTLHDPNAGMKFHGLEYIGGDIIIEFVSYNQSVQATAGFQRISCWLDEESPYDFFEEQVPRLIAEDGDIINSVTPAYGMSWTYDSIFEKAKVFVRSDTMVKYYKDYEDRVVKNIEITDSPNDIAVIQAATDDNPTIPPDVIEGMYNDMPDPDGTVIPTRRYGIFKQATGRIFKDFSYKIHMIDPSVLGITPEFISNCRKARTQDFHPSNPHAILWVAISANDEVFVYNEWSPSPDKWVTKKLCRQVSEKSGMDKFVCNLIDPLANVNDPEIGKTTVENMNREFYRLKKEGVGSGGYWEPYLTKGEVGRDAIKERLENSVKVGKPFNNKVDGGYIPTIWIFNKCKDCGRSLHHWRLETWKDNRQLAIRDRKEKPADKWSHFCTALEGLMKDKRFSPEGVRRIKKRRERRFQGDRR